jgi:hypothetical protein
VDLEEAVVGVCLAGEQALELALSHLLAQGGKALLGVGHHGIVALGLGELDEFERVVELTLDRKIAADRTVELVALAQ